MTATYVIGDIHGHATLLKELLLQIEKELTREDHVVFLGDYIDRGSDSKGVIDQIIEFRRKYPEQITCLKGNHEQWFLEAYQDYSKTGWLISMEGLSTVRSYSEKGANELEDSIRSMGISLFVEGQNESSLQLPYETFFHSIPKEHIQFFSELKLYYENDHLICSHSGLDAEGPPLEYQTEADLLWANTYRMLVDWKGPKTLVVGHVHTNKLQSEMHGLPIFTDYVVFVDTGSPHSGVLTGVRLPDQKIFQGRA